MQPRIIRRLLRCLNKAVPHPDTFSDRERDSILAILAELMESSDRNFALAAVSIVVRMERRNQVLDHREDWARLREKSVH